MIVIGNSDFKVQFLKRLVKEMASQILKVSNGMSKGKQYVVIVAEMFVALKLLFLI